MAHNGRNYLRQVMRRRRGHMMHDIVNPNIKRGTPPREITKADVVSAPVKRQGTWTLETMAHFTPMRQKGAPA